MSSIFSKVEVYDCASMQSIEFNAPGIIRDEDDFFDIPGMEEWFDEMYGDINVNAEVYIFGSGESYSATEEEIKALTEEFITEECDCIEIINFTIMKEDEEE